MSEKITLWSNGCPNCKIVKYRLDELGIEYDEINDMDEIRKVAGKLKVMMLPIMKVGEQHFSGVDAIKAVGEM